MRNEMLRDTMADIKAHREAAKEKVKRLFVFVQMMM